MQTRLKMLPAPHSFPEHVEYHLQPHQNFWKVRSCFVQLWQIFLPYKCKKFTLWTILSLMQSYEYNFFN